MYHGQEPNCSTSINCISCTECITTCIPPRLVKHNLLGLDSTRTRPAHPRHLLFLSQLGRLPTRMFRTGDRRRCLGSWLRRGGGGGTWRGGGLRRTTLPSLIPHPRLRHRTPGPSLLPPLRLTRRSSHLTLEKPRIPCSAFRLRFPFLDMIRTLAVLLFPNPTKKRKSATAPRGTNGGRTFDVPPGPVYSSEHSGSTRPSPTSCPADHLHPDQSRTRPS